MSFLDNLLASVKAPPGPNAGDIARSKVRRESEKKRLAAQKKVADDHESMVWKRVQAFIKDKDATVLKLKVMDRTQRAIAHEVCGTHNLASAAFGEEDVNRGIVCFKKGAGPTDEDLALLDRNLSYEDSLRDLEKRKAERKRLEEWKKGNADAPRRPPVKVAASGKREMLMNPALMQAQVIKASGSYGMVPQHMRNDKRSVDDVERERQAKRKKRTSQEAHEE